MLSYIKLNEENEKKIKERMENMYKKVIDWWRHQHIENITI